MSGGEERSPLWAAARVEESEIDNSKESRSASIDTPNAFNLDPGNIWEEIRRILKLAGPIALQDVLLLLQDTISVSFVGHIDRISLSCMTLATTMFNLTGLSLIMGLSMGAETLSGQCFGARNYRALGVILQRSLLITWLLCIVIVLGWTQLGSVLLWTGQEPLIVETSMKLVWLRLPALFLLAIIECLKRYLMAQGIVTPTCLAYVATTILTPLVNWVCIYGLNLGIEGSAIANDITCLLNCTFLLAYCFYLNTKLKGTGRETWAGWSLECLKKWGEYYKLAIPSTVMLCLEWWTFETIILMTGVLPDADTNLGVIGIMFQLGGLCYMVPLGLQGAASTRVSNELGRGRPYIAKKAVRAALSIGFCTQSIISLTVFTFRHQLGYLLTGDTEVVERTAAILPIMCLMIICDGNNAVSAGAIRGCGRQIAAACWNVVVFWCIGVPLAALLGFKTSLAVKGLWLGVAASVWTQFGVMVTYISCLNWEHEASRAAVLVQANKRIELNDEESSEQMWLKADERTGSASH